MPLCVGYRGRVRLGTSFAGSWRAVLARTLPADTSRANCRERAIATRPTPTHTLAHTARLFSNFWWMQGEITDWRYRNDESHELIYEQRTLDSGYTHYFATGVVFIVSLPYIKQFVHRISNQASFALYDIPGVCAASLAPTPAHRHAPLPRIPAPPPSLDLHIATAPAPAALPALLRHARVHWAWGLPYVDALVPPPHRRELGCRPAPAQVVAVRMAVSHVALDGEHAYSVLEWCVILPQRGG
jgi:hypothetical protein